MRTQEDKVIKFYSDDNICSLSATITTCDGKPYVILNGSLSIADLSKACAEIIVASTTPQPEDFEVSNVNR